MSRFLKFMSSAKLRHGFEKQRLISEESHLKNAIAASVWFFRCGRGGVYL